LVSKSDEQVTLWRSERESSLCKRIWTGFLKFSRAKPVGAVGGWVILSAVVISVCAQWMAPHDPREFVGEKYEAPNAEHFLGTDDLGRDVLSRVIYGGRISLFVGFVAVFVGVTIGLLVALVSGYIGGWVDALVQRFVDAMLAFPGIVLALFLVTAISPSLGSVVAAIAISFIPSCARTLGAQVLSIKATPYVDAARAIGCSHVRIMTRHMLPNIRALYVVLMSLYIGIAIIIEATLSFLGFGPSPEIASWGRMVSDGSRQMFLAGPWASLWPSIAIGLVVFSFNMLGDAVRDVWDPRLRGG
jgi:peptide/nickel transport system permease protein